VAIQKPTEMGKLQPMIDSWLQEILKDKPKAYLYGMPVFTSNIVPKDTVLIMKKGEARKFNFVEETKDIFRNDYDGD